MWWRDYPWVLEGSVFIDLEVDSSQWKVQMGICRIVFNGEIYDYKELRAELEAAGISFRTHSDTEVLVNTIQKYGEKALDKLRGMFGFAVWNEKEQTLMLARDFFGINAGVLCAGRRAFRICI